MVKVGAV